MSWIKSIILDLIILGVIITMVITGAEWARWVILIYTPLMVALKLIAVAGARSVPKMRKAVSGVPAVVYHLLYGANVALLLFGKEYLLAAGWALIWVLSIVVESRIAPAKTSA